MALENLQLYPGPVDFDETNPATYQTITGPSPNRVVLSFSKNANESIVFPFVMPQAYAGGTLTLVVIASMATATSGDVDMDAQVEARTPTDNEDLRTDSYDAANSADNNAVPGTAGLSFQVSITLANKDSVAPGDLVRIKLTRDQASDTASGQLWVSGVDLRES